MHYLVYIRYLWLGSCLGEQLHSTHHAKNAKILIRIARGFRFKRWHLIILGAFLLPYVVMLIIEGIPLLYLELSVGQRLKKGSLVAWSMISPYMGGVGLASVVICIFTGSYYSIIIAWCLYYLFSSFKSALPWSKCPTEDFFNFTSNRSFEIPVPECESSSSISYFFFRETLNVSESIDETTTWNWKITLCYITAWIVIYVCVIKGIKSSGKVIYHMDRTAILRVGWGQCWSNFLGGLGACNFPNQARKGICGSFTTQK